MSLTRRLILVASALVLLVGLKSWLAQKENDQMREGHPRELPKVAEREKPTGADPAIPAAAQQKAAEPAILSRLLPTVPLVTQTAQAKKAGLANSGLPEEVLNGTIIEKRDSPASNDGTFRRATVYRTTFKYPFVRVEQTLRRTSHGEEAVVAQLVMVADHLLIKVPSSANDSALKQHLNALGATVRRQLRGTSVYVVALRSPALSDYDATLAALERSPSLVTIAEPDFIVHAVGAPVIPDDTSFGQLWNLHNTGQSGGTADADIDAPEAWSVTTGSANVVVAVIDTGTDLTHPDLAPNLWTNPGETAGDGIDNDGNGYIDDMHGWNFVAGNNSPNDDHGHGSHTAGTVGAAGGNALGVTGVCQTVRLMPLKFLSASGSGTDSDAMEAVIYATENGAFLSSNSWGGGPNDPLMQEAILAADTAGVGFVAASGNSGVNGDLYPEYPASYEAPNVISVAATDRTDALAWFSNYGAQSVHLAAPGVQVYSTTMSGGYTTMSGTSMATPHVSGAAALLKAANPALTFSQIKAMLLSQTDAKASLAGKTITGGRLNVAKALVPATGPALTLGALTLDDSATGDSNGIPSPGETINALIRVTNSGAFAAANVQGTLALTNPPAGVALTTSTAMYGTIAAFDSVTNTAAPFVITIAPDVTPTDVPMTLTLTDELATTWTLSMVLKIRTVSSISGTVTKLTGGDPLPGATITITGAESNAVTSGLDGSFTIPVTNGTYSVTASATGYITSAAQTVNVPPAATTLSFVLGYSQSVVAPTSLSSTQLEGESTTQTFTLQNTGDQPLTYEIIDVPPPDAAVSSNHLMVSPPPTRSAKPSILETAPSRPLPFSAPSRTRDASDNWAVTLPFNDGFEDGMWGRWWSTGGAGTREVVSDTAGAGSKSFHFHFDGPDDHFTGIHQVFDYQKPGHISFWTRPGPEDLATSYMVLLDYYYVFDNTGFHPAYYDFIWFFANANGRFYVNDDVGGNQAVLYTQNQWYHIEFRNISWTKKNFDYWVDGQLIQAGVPFRNAAECNEMVFAVSYNYSGETDAWLDDARFYNDALPWISLSNTQGTILPGQSATITATFDAIHQLADHYTGSLQVRTNDPTTPNTNISVDMTVIATPNAVPVATPQSVTLGLNGKLTVTLAGSDADSDPLSCRIVALPAHGKLYQTSDGIALGDEIINTPTVVSNSTWKVIYQADPDDSGAHHGDFAFTLSDPKIASSPAIVGIDITPWPSLSATPSGGDLSAPQDVLFSSSDPAAIIRFTTDGSPPTTSSQALASAGSLYVDHSISITGSAFHDSVSSPPQTFTFTLPDANSNGLPDWWETLHPTIGSATEDDDHDGLTNSEEFTAATDPSHSDTFAAKLQTNPNARSISWASAQGRIYLVESSADLSSWAPASTPQVGTGSPMSWQDSTTVEQKFYRVRVSLP